MTVSLYQSIAACSSPYFWSKFCPSYCRKCWNFILVILPHPLMSSVHVLGRWRCPRIIFSFFIYTIYRSTITTSWHRPIYCSLRYSRTCSLSKVSSTSDRVAQTIGPMHTRQRQPRSLSVTVRRGAGDWSLTVVEVDVFVIELPLQKQYGVKTSLVIAYYILR